MPLSSNRELKTNSFGILGSNIDTSHWGFKHCFVFHTNLASLLCSAQLPT